MVEEDENRIEKIEYYDSGEIESRIEYKDSIKEGKAIFYYKNGNINAVEIYHDNKLNGQSIYFDSAGNKIATVMYQNGLRNGITREYFQSTGYLRTKANFEDGIANGTYVQYFEHDSSKVFSKIHLLNFKGEEKEFGSIWYDSLGNVIDEYRRVVIKVNKDTFNLNEKLELAIEVKKPRFDSTYFVINGFDDKFYVTDSTQFDTLYAENHIIKITKKADKKGENAIRGFAQNLTLISRNEEETIYEIVNPIYFEFKYFVK